MRSLVVVAILVFSSNIVTNAWAQSGSVPMQADVNARADEQFRKGREEQDRGNWQRALAYFRDSHALKPGRGTLLNMGLCEQKLGLLATSMRHLEELLPQLPAGDERRQLVRDTLAEIKPKVPHLRITLNSRSPAGTVVTYDNAELESSLLDTDIPVDPGTHTITVEGPGLPNRSYDVYLELGQRRVMSVEPGELQSDATTPASPQSPKKFVGLVLIGVGAAGLLTGAISGAVALRDYNAAMDACPTRINCSRQTIDVVEHGRTASIVNTVALAVGVVGVAVGIPLVVLAGKTKSAPTVGLWISNSGGQVGVSGRF